VDGDQLRLVGFIASVDGSTSVRGEVSGSVTDAELLGIRLAERLLDQGGRQILEEVYKRELDA
jgi:hydroxymethylbilane synthase